MTILSNVRVDWDASPRVITVLSPATTISIQDLVDTCRSLEAELVNLAFPKLINASGKDQLGIGVYVGITCTMLNAQLAFEARGGPSFVQCIVSGGNLVAVDTSNVIINPIYTTAFTQANYSSSSSATLILSGGSIPTAVETAQAVWDLVPSTPVAGSFGEIVYKKLLRFVKSLGLK